MKDNVIVGFIVAAMVGVVFGLPALGIWKYASNRPTTYCTKWTRAKSIEPTNSDNGKYSDEQYIVKYEDGSVAGQDQGAIPYARCTDKVRVHHSQKQLGWKTVNNYTGVDWEE